VAVAAVLTVITLSVLMAVNFRAAAQGDRKHLFESLISQAQAERRAGERQRSLELLAEAAKMRRTERLRQEAIQTITSSGVRLVRVMVWGNGRARSESPGFGEEVFSPVFSLDGQRVAFAQNEKEGERIVLRVCDFRSGQVLAERDDIRRNDLEREDLHTPLRFRPTTPQLAIAKDNNGPVTCLWDPVAGKDLGTYQGGNPVFSPNGALLATSSDQRIHIWDLVQGREAKPPPRGTPLQFLSQRELLLAEKGTYRRWDFTMGRETFATPKGLVGIAVCASGRLAVLHGRPINQSRDALVVWDLLAGKQVAQLPYVGVVPSSGSFSPDDKQLALLDTSYKKTTILVWDLATGSLISRLSSRALQPPQAFWRYTWSCPAPSFSRDGTFLGAVGVRGGEFALCVWDVETGAEVKVLPQIRFFWWREKGRRLVTLAPRIQYPRVQGPRSIGAELGNHGFIGEKKYVPAGHLNLWDVIRPTPTYLFDANVQTSSFNGDGSRLAVNDVVWDVKKNAEGYSLHRSAIRTQGLLPVFGGREEVWGASLKSEDRAYATLWQLAPEKRKYVLRRPDYPKIDKQVREGLLQPLKADRLSHFQAYLLALSPDGKRALVASSATFVVKRGGAIETAFPLELWDPIAGKRLAFWNQDNYFLGPWSRPKVESAREAWIRLRFSPDGKRAATSSSGGLKIWNVSRGEVEKTLIPGVSDDVVDQLAFSQDGKRVLAVAQGPVLSETLGRAVLFAVETGEELRSWEAPRREGGWWNSSALSPDARWVVSGGKDGLIRLWDVTSCLVAKMARSNCGTCP
jgi:WD40 repeat protein